MKPLARLTPRRRPANARPAARAGRQRLRRRWLLGLALALLTALAACSAADPPRGGPQLPSTPSFLSGGSSGSPSPSGALPAKAPSLPVIGGWLSGTHAVHALDPEVAAAL